MKCIVCVHLRECVGAYASKDAYPPTIGVILLERLCYIAAHPTHTVYSPKKGKTLGVLTTKSRSGPSCIPSSFFAPARAPDLDVGVRDRVLMFSECSTIRPLASMFFFSASGTRRRRSRTTSGGLAVCLPSPGPR